MGVYLKVFEVGERMMRGYIELGLNVAQQQFVEFKLFEVLKVLLRVLDFYYVVNGELL